MPVKKGRPRVRSMRGPAIRAFRAAVRGVVQESLETGLPFYILRDGKVVALSDKELRSLLKRRKRRK